MKSQRGFTLIELLIIVFILWLSWKWLSSIVEATAQVEEQSSVQQIEDKIAYYEKICLQGIVYWEGYYRLAPVITLDGAYEVCGAALQDAEAAARTQVDRLVPQSHTVAPAFNADDTWGSTDGN